LREWPDNDAARMGQANLTRVLARFELDQGHLGSVTELLSTLDVPDAELDRALQAAVEAREVAAGELDALKHSRDMRFGAELRRRQAITWSIGLGLFHLVCGVLTWADIARPEHGTLIAFSFFGLIASSYGNYDLRRHSTSEASLRVANSAAAMPFFMLGFWIFAWWLDLDFGPALGLALFLQTAMVLQSALLQSVSTVAASAAGGTFAIAAILWPEAAWFMVAFGTTIQTAGIGIAVSTAVDDDSAIG